MADDLAGMTLSTTVLLEGNLPQQLAEIGESFVKLDAQTKALQTSLKTIPTALSGALEGAKAFVDTISALSTPIEATTSGLNSWSTAIQRSVSGLGSFSSELTKIRTQMAEIETSAKGIVPGIIPTYSRPSPSPPRSNAEELADQRAFRTDALAARAQTAQAQADAAAARRESAQAATEMSKLRLQAAQERAEAAASIASGRHGSVPPIIPTGGGHGGGGHRGPWYGNLTNPSLGQMAVGWAGYHDLEKSMEGENALHASMVEINAGDLSNPQNQALQQRLLKSAYEARAGSSLDLTKVLEAQREMLPRMNVDVNNPASVDRALGLFKPVMRIAENMQLAGLTKNPEAETPFIEELITRFSGNSNDPTKLRAVAGDLNAAFLMSRMNASQFNTQGRHAYDELTKAGFNEHEALFEIARGGQAGNQGQTGYLMNQVLHRFDKFEDTAIGGGEESMRHQLSEIRKGPHAENLTHAMELELQGIHSGRAGSARAAAQREGVLDSSGQLKSNILTASNRIEAVGNILHDRYFAVSDPSNQAYIADPQKRAEAQAKMRAEDSIVWGRPSSVFHNPYEENYYDQQKAARANFERKTDIDKTFDELSDDTLQKFKQVIADVSTIGEQLGMSVLPPLKVAFEALDHVLQSVIGTFQNNAALRTTVGYGTAGAAVLGTVGALRWGANALNRIGGTAAEGAAEGETSFLSRVLPQGLLGGAKKFFGPLAALGLGAYEGYTTYEEQKTGAISQDEAKKSYFGIGASTLGGIAGGAAGGMLTGGPIGALVGGAAGAIGGQALIDWFMGSKQSKSDQHVDPTAAINTFQKGSQDLSTSSANLNEAANKFNGQHSGNQRPSDAVTSPAKSSTPPAGAIAPPTAEEQEKLKQLSHPMQSSMVVNPKLVGAQLAMNDTGTMSDVNTHGLVTEPTPTPTAVSEPTKSDSWFNKPFLQVIKDQFTGAHDKPHAPEEYPQIPPGDLGGYMPDYTDGKNYSVSHPNDPSWFTTPLLKKMTEGPRLNPATRPYEEDPGIDKFAKEYATLDPNQRFKGVSETDNTGGTQLKQYDQPQPPTDDLKKIIETRRVHHPATHMQTNTDHGEAWVSLGRHHRGNLGHNLYDPSTGYSVPGATHPGIRSGNPVSNLHSGPQHSSTSSLAGSGNPASEAHMMKFFMDKGWSKAQSAGITANLMAESKGNPNAVGDSGNAHGLAQWHGDREKSLATAGFNTRGTADEQLAAVDYELKHQEKRAGDALSKAQTAKEAGSIVSMKFERPRDTQSQALARGAAADRIFESSADKEAAYPSTKEMPTKNGVQGPWQVPARTNYSTPESSGFGRFGYLTNQMQAPTPPPITVNTHIDGERVASNTAHHMTNMMNGANSGVTGFDSAATPMVPGGTVRNMG